MPLPILTPLQLKNGVWSARLDCDAQPDVQVSYRGDTLEDLRLSETECGWILEVPVPAEALSDGVHSFVVLDKTSTEKLGDFTVIAGVAAAQDMRAEIGLLRAELDLLKRAFRRAQSDPD